MFGYKNMIHKFHKQKIVSSLNFGLRLESQIFRFVGYKKELTPKSKDLELQP